MFYGKNYIYYDLYYTWICIKFVIEEKINNTSPKQILVRIFSLLISSPQNKKINVWKIFIRLLENI